MPRYHSGTDLYKYSQSHIWTDDGRTLGRGILFYFTAVCKKYVKRRENGSRLQSPLIPGCYLLKKEADEKTRHPGCTKHDDDHRCLFHHLTSHSPFLLISVFNRFQLFNLASWQKYPKLSSTLKLQLCFLRNLT
jgi:hypothetical protein